ncbi:MAG: hypothetical protein RIC57_05085 [Balneola sp.]
MNTQKIIERLKELVNKRNHLTREIMKVDGAIDALKDLIDVSEVDDLHVLDYEEEQTEIDSNESPLTKEIEEKKKEKTKYVYDDGYHINLSNRNKVKFVIKAFDKFLHNRQIAEELHRREPHVSEDKWSRKVSGALSSLRRNGELVNYSVNDYNRNTFWGSPKWLQENGEIIDKYMYDEEYIQYGDNIEI